MLTGSDDYLIKVWCARTGRLINTFRGHQNVVTEMSLNTENTLLASSSMDGTVRVWDLQTGEPKAVLPGNPNNAKKSITGVKFSPSPIPEIRYLASIGEDGVCRLYRWDRNSLTFNKAPFLIDGKQGGRDNITCFTFNATGSCFAFSTKEGFVCIYSTFQPPVGWDKNLQLSLSHLSRNDEGSPNNIKWGAPKLICQFTAHNASISTLSYNHDGTELLTGAEDGTAKLWRFDTNSRQWKCIQLEIKEDIPTVRVPVENPGNENEQAGSAIATSNNNTNRSNDADLPEVVVPLNIQDDVSTATPSQNILIPDPNSPLTTTASQILQSEDLGIPSARPPSDQQDLTSATTLPLNPHMASADPEGTSPSAPLHPQSTSTIERPIVERIETNMVVWSCDDLRILASNNIGTVFAFEAKTGKLLWKQRAHEMCEVYVLAAHPTDPRLAFSGGYDNMVILWDIKNGCMLKKFHLQDQVFDGTFSDDGSTFAVVGDTGAAQLFGLTRSIHQYDFARRMPEQVFPSDYMATVLDSNLNVIDEYTQLAPHLLPHGPLMDFDGREYQVPNDPRYGMDIEYGLDPGLFSQEDTHGLSCLKDETSSILLNSAEMIIDPRGLQSQQSLQQNTQQQQTLQQRQQRQRAQSSGSSRCTRRSRARFISNTDS